MEVFENFKEEFDACEPFLLKNIRYSAEVLSRYQATPNLLANIIQLVVLLIGNHLDGVAAYLNALSGVELSETGLTASTTSTATNLTGSINKCSMTSSATDSIRSSVGECPVEFMLEFMTRYRQYRHTAIELEVCCHLTKEKLGFVFKHFVMVF
ncbi:MAG: hypothetical protein JST59_00700 [Actinobacteria bacterium]|nr:hypothetical protein [Actinomycetota bacterium]